MYSAICVFQCPVETTSFRFANHLYAIVVCYNIEPPTPLEQKIHLGIVGNKKPGGLSSFSIVVQWKVSLICFGNRNVWGPLREKNNFKCISNGFSWWPEKLSEGKTVV